MELELTLLKRARIHRNNFRILASSTPPFVSGVAMIAAKP
jgi:hypothetical protein